MTILNLIVLSKIRFIFSFHFFFKYDVYTAIIVLLYGIIVLNNIAVEALKNNLKNTFSNITSKRTYIEEN